jgi:hypothetical protein
MAPLIGLVFIFTFIIHLTGIIAYALRLAGTRTGKVALSISMFNILHLVSRTSLSLQGPLLAKHVEQNIANGTFDRAETDFRILLLASSLAILFGAMLIPTAQRLFSKAVESLYVHRSFPKLFIHILKTVELRHIRDTLKLPNKENLTQFRRTKGFPWRLLIANTTGTALITVGGFASLYAGYLNPELRVTSNNLSPVINGFSTFLLFVFIDPYLSMIMDDVVNGKVSNSFFRQCVILFIASHFVGTLLAQTILIPGARLIVFVAQLL